MNEPTLENQLLDKAKELNHIAKKLDEIDLCVVMMPYAQKELMEERVKVLAEYKSKSHLFLDLFRKYLYDNKTIAMDIYRYYTNLRKLLRKM